MGKIALIILGVLLLFVLIIGGAGLSSYNGLVESRNLVDKQWAQVENNLQRRADLIPNLVNTVKGYANIEQSVLTQIAQAQSIMKSGSATPEQKMDASNQMTGALQRGGLLGAGLPFMTLVQAYPQLKSDQQFLRLQDELAGTENRLAVARKDYNDSVNDYNTKRQKFPTVIVASLTGFQDKPFFKADEGAKTAPKVDFSK
ncbi:MAG: LemA family protein [Acidobacteria bacterium]|nr:LemA family protein [Acidobacteriota bacterium]